MNSQVKQLILDAAVTKISEAVFEHLMDYIHDAIGESMDEVLGPTVDYDKEETFDLMMELSSRIAIVALPE